MDLYIQPSPRHHREAMTRCITNVEGRIVGYCSDKVADYLVDQRVAKYLTASHGLAYEKKEGK